VKILTGVEMIKKLKNHGIKHIKVKGSHYHYFVNGKIFQVPHHHKEMGKGLENAILKDAGLKG
jgi:predicted RNA binding protein YcfA (HicA-like mRNA interferase family)